MNAFRVGLAAVLGYLLGDMVAALLRQRSAELRAQLELLHQRIDTVEFVNAQRASEVEQ